MKEDNNRLLEIAQIAAELCGDPSVVEGVMRHAEATAIISTLEDTRVYKGLLQKDIAKRMGVSVSTVSRIEDTPDAELRYGDIVKYADALGMKATLFLEDPSRPAEEQMKHCVFKISELLKQLTELARECPDYSAIVDGIMRFRGEVLFNFFARYLESDRDATVFASTKGHTPRKEAASGTAD